MPPVYQTIQRLWNDEGMTMGKIAARLKCSRSSVAGIMFRMRKDGVYLISRKTKLVLLANTTPSLAPVAQPVPVAQLALVETTPVTVPVAQPAPVETTPVPTQEIPSLPRDIPNLTFGPVSQMNATKHHCRFPMSEKYLADDFFCGRMVAEKSSYCEEHAAQVRGPKPIIKYT